MRIQFKKIWKTSSLGSCKMRFRPWILASFMTCWFNMEDGSGSKMSSKWTTSMVTKCLKTLIEMTTINRTTISIRTINLMVQALCPLMESRGRTTSLKGKCLKTISHTVAPWDHLNGKEPWKSRVLLGSHLPNSWARALPVSQLLKSNWPSKLLSFPSRRLLRKS